MTDLEARRHAVVIGAGMAGLTAAVALAGHFDRVTVLERDALPDEPVFRPGVPQSRHLHSLMGAGQRALDELVPGFTGRLYDAGAIPLRTPYDHLWFSPAGWCHRFPPSHTVPSASRELIEAVVRRAAVERHGVAVRHRTEVTGLDGEPGGAVTGVHAAPRDGGAPERLPADLVVDASGRRSRVPAWLTERGHGTAETTVVDSRAGYSSRLYEIPGGSADEWRVISIQPGPGQPTRGGALVPVEGGRRLVSLYGYLDDHPPTDEDGFLAFAASLRHPVLHDVLRSAEPAGPIHGFRNMANRRWHGEDLPAWPDGLLVAGDALCAVNPVYAQGMSMAAMTAVLLDRLLAEGGADGRTLQKRLAAGNERAWQVATGADLAHLGTGAADEAAAETAAYMQRLLELALVDADVNRTFFDVMMMLDEPGALFAPELTARVARGPARPAAG
ncbi:NAD(P)/FAD-dependent oxidoreductase [Actinomadura flavalba]|uniref:NAD(P)/FAD-dependent oxidoreductase n=1 Tax=Actinomadura flavalba TaxID=1120938 RepID=UPI000367BA8F|nr:FAD-dependent monooxygenase [Actinomadura flavalba]